MSIICIKNNRNLKTVVWQSLLHPERHLPITSRNVCETGNKLRGNSRF